MACTYTYQGKTYDREDFTKILLNMKPSEASKYMLGVSSVPDAPFVRNTGKWPLLAMKRMVRYAAENGFDSVSWTTGDMQAERYDLSKQVDSIEAQPQGGLIGVEIRAKGSADTISFNVKGGVVQSSVGISADGKPLEDVVGKEMAEKILAVEKTTKFEGNDLKVGGEGMKGFYDKILPTAVNAFFNKAKWGKARVGTVDIQTEKQIGDDVTAESLMEAAKAAHRAGDKSSGGFLEEQAEKVSNGEDYSYAIYNPNPWPGSKNPPSYYYDKVRGFSDKYIESWSLPITTEMRGKARLEGMPLFQKRPPTKTTPLDIEAALPDLVARQMAASRGVPKETLLQRAKAAATDIKHQRQHFPDLQKVEDVDERHQLADILRRHQEVPETAKARAILKIKSFVDGLAKDEYDAYRMNIMLDDMVRDINDGLTEDGKLPFGFETTEQVFSAQEKFHRMATENQKVGQALRARKTFINSLKRDLVKYKILKKDVLDKEDYYHHQILIYWQGKYGLTTSSSDVRTHWRPWQAARKGTIHNYNTEYIEAEFMALSQQMAQLETARTLKRIKSLSDIYQQLKARAKQANIVALWAKLRKEGRIEKHPKTGEDVDPLLPYKQNIAMSNMNLAKMAAAGKLEYDSEWQDLVDTMVEAYQNYKLDKSEWTEAIDDDAKVSLAIDHPRWFHFLSYLIRTNKPGANWAATIFKAIRGRDKFIETELGEAHKTWKQMIPEGYTIWKPDPGKGWFWTNSIADNILQKMIEGEIDPKDAEFRRVLAKGRELIWVIPQGLADTMDKFREWGDPTMAGKIADFSLAAWKRYILMNPYSVIKYNVNNMSGDADAALAYAPEIVRKRKYAWRAALDLAKWHRRGEMTPELEAELEHARALGVIGSGFTAQEVEDIPRAFSMDKLMRQAVIEEKANWFNPKTWGQKYWHMVRGVTTWRENILRLAAWRYFKDNANKKLYGASKPAEIDAIKDRDERAAKLARELLGDYGNISKTGEYLRKRLMPFYAWLEINTPRYVYMMRNTKYEDATVGAARKGRFAFVGAKKMVMSAAKMAIRAQMLYGAVILWNMVMFPDEERELGESGRRQLHIILGRREDGEIITLRFQGALSDALSFFAIEDWPSDIKDIKDGRATVMDKLKEVPIALLNRGFQAIRPDVKLLGEVPSKKAFYPDVLNPRPVRDTVEHVLRTFKLEKLYRLAAKKPGRGGSFAGKFVNDLKTLLVYESDPGEQAYYDTRKLALDWKADQGHERSYGTPTKKGNALYYYKQALKYGDIQAAEKYLRKYYDMGGTRQGLSQGIKQAHPLSSIPKSDRYKFRRSLSPADDERVAAAMEWYRKTYK